MQSASASVIWAQMFHTQGRWKHLRAASWQGHTDISGTGWDFSPVGCRPGSMDESHPQRGKSLWSRQHNRSQGRWGWACSSLRVLQDAFLHKKEVHPYVRELTQGGRACSINSKVGRATVSCIPLLFASENLLAAASFIREDHHLRGYVWLQSSHPFSRGLYFYFLLFLKNCLFCIFILLRKNIWGQNSFWNQSQLVAWTGGKLPILLTFGWKECFT